MARMSDSPRHGATDPDGKVWRTDRVYVADAEGFDRSRLPGDYLLLSCLPGRPLTALRADLPDADVASVRSELGRAVAALHTVQGKTFGYPRSDAVSDGWADTLRAMVGTVLADASRLGADLTLPADGIRALIDSRLDLLTAVETPVLVHFDLWDGNVLVERDGGARLTGVIDAERAFWGDPYADFVSLALFGDIENDAAFLDGYRRAGGHAEFTPDTRLRMRMYRVYLYLIMLTEGYVRGYTPEEAAGLRTWLGPLLAAELDALADA